MKKVKKEPKEPKILKEKKEKTLKKTEQKEEKPVLLARKSLVERNGNIPNSVEMKPLLPAKQAKSAEMKATADPVKQLAEKLNGRIPGQLLYHQEPGRRFKIYWQNIKKLK